MMGALLVGIYVFVLAIFVGFEIITKIPPTLHTPLMSGANAISGITILGALVAARSGEVTVSALLGLFAVMVSAKGGYLDHFPAEANVNDPEAPPDDPGVPEQGVDFLGRGVGGHVEVLGMAAQEQVSHGAANKVGLVIVLVETRHDFQGTAADVFARHAVLIPGYDFQRQIRPAGVRLSPAGMSVMR